MRRLTASLAAILAVLACLSAVSAAEPKPKPRPVAASLGDPTKPLFLPGLMSGLADRLSRSGPLLSDADRQAFEDAYNAANRHDWPRALEIGTGIHHAIASKIITWAYLSAEDTNPSFDELVRFSQSNPDWPLQDTLLEKAEKALPDSMPPARLIAWFAGQEPLTGQGMIRLGAALIAQGEKDYGARWLKLAWSTHDFSDDEQRTIYATYKDYLKGQPTTDRVDYLLWSYNFDQAQPLLSELPDDVRRLAEARIALMKQSSDAPSLVQALSSSQQADPSIVFERVRYLRRAGKDDDARALLLSVKDPDKVPRPEKWWVERSYQARQALDNRKYDDAYALLSESGLAKGEAYADAEWMAGWVALRFLNRPKLALQHFQALEANVTFPISLARAHYWAGRAAQAMGDTPTAFKAYSDAVAFPYTFYGQLAAGSALLSNQKLDLAGTPPVDESKWGSFVNGELITAIRLLKEIDGERYMRTFGYYLVDKAETPDDIALVAELFREVGQTAISVRVAKRASQQHTLLTDYLYPVVAVPRFIGVGTPPEPALVLGFVRQESEFNPKAISSAGAIGILQLMPSTAKLAAKKNGIAYSGISQLSEPDYSFKLGMAHISDLLDYYNGSYILAAAAYNAGVNNVDTWIRTAGDPRTSDIDPIDWIEGIPFTETRNYVQRVLENTQVYRQRIANRPVEFALATDLKRTRATPLDLSYLQKSAPSAPEAAATPPAAPAPMAQSPTAAAAAAPSSPPAASASQTLQPPSSPLADSGAPPVAPGSLGIAPAQTPSPSINASPDASAAPDLSAPIAAQQTAAPLDRNWNIPATCAAFIVRADHSAECIDQAPAPLDAH